MKVVHDEKNFHDSRGTIVRMNTFLTNARAAARLWYDTDADQKAATVSYYMIFALVPLLLLSIAIHSVVFGKDFIIRSLYQWGDILGQDVLTFLTEAVTNLETISLGIGIPVVGVLFFTMMVIMMFNTFTSGIHGIWGMRHRGLYSWLRKCKHSVAFIVVFEIYLFCMLLLNMAVPFVAEHLSLLVVVLFDAVIFLIMTTVLFSLTFRILPWQSPAFKSRLWGSAVASVLLYMARSLVAVYVAITPVPSLFGVAGLLVVLLIWTFISTAIIYYGAAFAYVHGGRQLQ